MSDQAPAPAPNINLAHDSHDHAHDHDHAPAPAHERDSDRQEKYAVTHTIRLDPPLSALASRALDIWEEKQNAETQSTINDLTSRVKTLTDKLTAAQSSPGSPAKPKPAV